ncbi:uncharacterized protein [Lepisosteus oculatus]|uniref:uncharacterized protein n=1 Tax=Lepisosteus oculatus TaxID=7918 RepID=UPI0035F5005B
MSPRPPVPRELWHCFLGLLVAAAAVQGAASESCLLISEVNADNPSYDSTEFVELYHTSGRRTSLDGYTLVFYNGNGNLAYKVLNLGGNATDEQGFFLVGSAGVKPPPAVVLPPNTVQNGPDGIALYHGGARYAERMNVTAEGLVDAIVYRSRRGGEAEFLAEVLTPGFPVFLEDESLYQQDESMERCWLFATNWTFQTGPPSPGLKNPCATGRAREAQISELSLGEGVFLELSVPQPPSALVLALLNGTTGAVEFSMDINASRAGLLLMCPSGCSREDAVLLPPKAESVLKQQGSLSGAVALYSGMAADFPHGAPLSPRQPIDAFVFLGEGGEQGASFVETLIPGRQAFLLTSRSLGGGVSLSRCGAAVWSRDTELFVEAPPTPGQANQCSGVESCPHNVVVPESTAAPPPLPPSPSPAGYQDFLLSEVNSDTPGAAEDREFIEIWHPSGRRVSLDGIWLLLFNGNDDKPYRQISLHGYFTDARGYFLLGSHQMSPRPAIRLPPNTVQNGPDAVALYRSPLGPPVPKEGGAIPTKGLLDAIVYRGLRSDKEAQNLRDALTPGQVPLLEDPDFSPEDESLSRCGSLLPANLTAFQVTPLTPLKKNACGSRTTPEPPLQVVINEVSASWTNGSQQEAFVELVTTPHARLQGLTLLLFEQGHNSEPLAVPLKGSASSDGLYVLGNTSNADQTLPISPSRAWRAVALYQGYFQTARARLIDAVVLAEDQELLEKLNTTSGQHMLSVLSSMKEPVSLSRCSCCEVRNPHVWIASGQTPGQVNHCPSSGFSSELVLCLGPKTNRLWQQVPGCAAPGQKNESLREMQSEIAQFLEESCHCGISGLYLQETNISCEDGLLHVSGQIQGLSADQRDLILKTTSALMLKDSCTEVTMEKFQARKAGLGWEIALIIIVLLTLGLGAALGTYWYRKRRPHNYSTIELSEQAEGEGEFDL